ncbi:thiolase family protein [Desertimonas flava]|uniref:thiolase family protein n=1 Tax=Desertimonas flava TaxID=2064846 RepID=UPI000E351786|nr:thiolase family protein [Desertimonas flava]
MSRYPIQDQIAIVGVGSTGYRRSRPDRSLLSFVAEAATQAIIDSGLSREDIGGVCGVAPYVPGWFGVNPQTLTGTLGLPEVHYQSFELPPIGHVLSNAMHAVFAGACDAALVYNGIYRSAALSRSAAADPVRRQIGPPDDAGFGLMARVDFAAYGQHYFETSGATREHLGLIAINGRTGALHNDLAVMDAPLTMEQYLAGRMIRDPLCIYDCDVPVDGADAFVLTTAERARDLPGPAVLIHAATVANAGTRAVPGQPALVSSGQHVAAASLRERSDLWIDDMDVYFPYDGFSVITLAAIEAMGFAPAGAAPELLEDWWSDAEQRLLVGGRVPVNPHGGALSEGGTQGSGHVREAVLQLRGHAGARQVPGARTAILNPGGMFHNPQGFVFRSDA